MQMKHVYFIYFLPHQQWTTSLKSPLSGCISDDYTALQLNYPASPINNPNMMLLFAFNSGRFFNNFRRSGESIQDIALMSSKVLRMPTKFATEKISSGQRSRIYCFVPITRHKTSPKFAISTGNNF
jgi:hypothetical protein